MEFASEYILEEDDVYEKVSDDEFDKGMSVSSDSEEEMMPISVKRLSSASEREECLSLSVSDKAQPAPRAVLSASKTKGFFARLRKSKKPAEPRKQSHWKSSPSYSKSTITKQEVQQKDLNKRWFRRADTNIVSVKFDTLLAPGDMHAGEPVICAQCGAILSHISILRTQGSDKVWCCEFCNTSAPVDVEEEERPKSEDMTYLLEPAKSTTSSSMSGMDQSMVIFVVDTSGSMCVTTEVSGKVKLRGTDQLEKLQSFNTLHEDQYLPSQHGRNVTYISRLQAMQAAVDHQLEEMSKEHGSRRVGLVTFNNEVTVIGDGSETEVTIAGDKLTNQEELRKEAEKISLTQSIRQSRKVLGDKIYKLEEGGATALGPAIVVAVSLASQHPGSKVILCTDGKANIGLGKLEEPQDEEGAIQFYGDVGERALAAGVTVSVITISGTDCKLVHLGQISDKTGGQVNIVDPLKLTEEFSNILSDPVIATKVKATFILHKDLYIFDELDPKKQECRMEKQVGNAYSSSTITFQFAPRKKKASAKIDEKKEQEEGKETNSTEADTSSQGAAAPSKTEAKQPKDLPFQLQIEYIDTEGNKALRVLTRTKQSTNDRQLAEQKANLDILGVHAAKTSANLALHGHYSQSRGVALMHQRLAWRSCQSEEAAGSAAPREKAKKYKSIFGRIKNMENRLNRQQKSEISTRGRTYSDDEDSDEDFPDSECQNYYGNLSLAPKCSEVYCSPPIPKPKMMRAARRTEMSDDTARMFYEFRQNSKPSVEVLPPPPPIPIRHGHGFMAQPTEDDNGKDKKSEDEDNELPAVFVYKTKNQSSTQVNSFRLLHH